MWVVAGRLAGGSRLRGLLRLERGGLRQQQLHAPPRAGRRHHAESHLPLGRVAGRERGAARLERVHQRHRGDRARLRAGGRRAAGRD